MRLACCAYSYRDLLTSRKISLQDFIRTCAEMGLDGVELTAYYFPNTERATLNEIKRTCFQYGMHVSGTAVGNNFAQADPAKRREHVEMTKQWIDHAVTLGAPCIRVFAGAVPEGHTEDEAFGWVVECLREVIDYGAQRGVVVALENHHGITATAEQVLRLVKAVQHTWFGLNLDLGNFTGDIYAQFEQLAPYVVTTHAKTHYRGHNGKYVEVDYERALRILQKAGYRGYVSIEYEYTEPAEQAVPRFVRHLKQVLQRLA